ncbi:MAG: hypothetical protein ACLQU2_24800 [Candidatus Binataceae bacterium]
MPFQQPASGMADPALLNTARGTYRLSVAEQAASDEGSWTLTLAAEHQGGLEKFAFRCRIAGAVLQRAAVADSAAACVRLAAWLQGQFEQVREAALKSIRAERRLLEFEFDESRPGPF